MVPRAEKNKVNLIVPRDWAGTINSEMWCHATLPKNIPITPYSLHDFKVFHATENFKLNNLLCVMMSSFTQINVIDIWTTLEELDHKNE